MDNLNNIPNVGNWGDAASKLNDNFNKVKQAVTTVENTSKNNKGYFTSLSALNTAFPSPKVGQTAYVYDEASSTNYYIYNAVNGAWVASSIEAPSVGVDLAAYTKTGGSTKTLKEVDDDLVQLAGEVNHLTNITATYQQSDTPYANAVTTTWLFVYDSPITESGKLTTLKFAQPIPVSFASKIAVCEKGTTMKILALYDVTVNSQTVDVSALNIEVLAGQYVGLVNKITGADSLYKSAVQGSVKSWYFLPENIAVNNSTSSLAGSNLQYDYSYTIFEGTVKDAIGEKLDKTSVQGELGASPTSPISQKAVTDNISSDKEYLDSSVAGSSAPTTGNLWVIAEPVQEDGRLATLKFAQPIPISFASKIAVCEKNASMKILALYDVTVNSQTVDVSGLNIEVLAGQYVGLVNKITGADSLYKMVTPGEYECWYFLPANIAVDNSASSKFSGLLSFDFSFTNRVIIANSIPVINRRLDEIETQVIPPPFKERLFLPNTITAELGKPLYIFKNSISSVFNYKNYNIQLTLSANPTDGDDYHRHVIYTPTAVGQVTATFKLYDNARRLLDTKSCVINTVNRTTQPDTMKTILFIGDSLTFYNRITDEFVRVLTSNDIQVTAADTCSIYTVIKIAGRDWGNIQLIGTQKNDYKGWTGQTYHEGMSGWSWATFLGASSPFVLSGALNFTNYLTVNSFTQPDIVYIGLGWNDIYTIAYDSYDVSPIITNARTFLTAITTQWPTTQIRLWTQNVPGIYGGVGYHPHGATDLVDEQRYKILMLTLAEAYKTFETEFATVNVVQATAQIDSEYSLQEIDANVNSRINLTEKRGIDYIHPADAGFFQIADALIADFVSLI